MTDILFVTDFVCPYCIVAKEALKQALQETGIQARIRICPMELTREPEERVDTYHDAKRKERYRILEEPARKLGLSINLPPAVVPRPYTRLAFEGLHFAEERGLGEAYSDRMYQAYFTDEQDIGSLEVLTGLAGSIGLDKEEFRKALLSGTYRRKEEEACRYAEGPLNVKQIPTIFIDGQRIELHDYTKEEMIRILGR